MFDRVVAFGLPGTRTTVSVVFNCMVPPQSGQSREGVADSDIARFTVAPVPCLDKHRTRSYRWCDLPVTRDFDQPHECFADEIAIDFPSIGDLVERVRDRFLGEGTDGADAPATHVAEVSLSRRDATTGIVVSLEVPLRGTCRLCGGRGETWTEPCAACRGTGEALVQRPVRL